MADQPRFVPFSPEPIERLRARFPRALERVWEFHPRTGMNVRSADDLPSLHARQVFDLETPMVAARLIAAIIRDVSHTEGATFLHVTAAFSRGAPSAQDAGVASCAITSILHWVAGPAMPASFPLEGFACRGGGIWDLSIRWPVDEAALLAPPVTHGGFHG